MFTSNVRGSFQPSFLIFKQKPKKSYEKIFVSMFETSSTKEGEGLQTSARVTIKEEIRANVVETGRSIEAINKSDCRPCNRYPPHPPRTTSRMIDWQ